MTLNRFNEVRVNYKSIEPILDNYSVAEITFLSFERMRSSLFYRNEDGEDNFQLQKKIFDSKVKILEQKSEKFGSFFYDNDYIKILNVLKHQSSLLSELCKADCNDTKRRHLVLIQLDTMEATLVDLQEIIYTIQIRNFSKTKGIIQDNTTEAETLALACLSLLFGIILILIVCFCKLRKTLKEKNIFISSIYHELSNSIQLILMATDLITIEQEEAAGIITNHTTKLLEHTKDILDYSKIEMGHNKIRKEPFLIDDVIGEAISNIRNRNNNIITIYHSGANTPIYSDKEKISRILANLFDNANKNTHNGKVTISAKIVKGKLYLSVRDNGCGFDIKKLQHLFKAFNQGAEKDTKQGLGLGLTIIKSHLVALKGNIRVKSREGDGAFFIISIPLSN